MPRRTVIAKRIILPDSIYGSRSIAKFINAVMLSGKKSVAERIVYDAFKKVEERLKAKKDHAHKDKDDESGGGTGGDSRFASVVEWFEATLDIIRPTVEVKARRVGGSTYQVPVEVRASRRETLAMRWIIEAAHSRGEKGMALKLAGEICDILEHKGGAVKKRETVQQMAKSNQAFAHFAK